MRRPFSPRFLPAALAIVLAVGASSCDKLASLGGKKDGKGAALPPASPEALASAAATQGGKVHPVTEADFNALAQVPDRLVVVDFYADWCGPCRQLAPVLQSLATEFPSNVLFLKVNVDENKSLAKKHGVKGIPDLRFFLNGQQVDSMVGAGSAESIRKIITTHAPEAKPGAKSPVVQNGPAAAPPRDGIFGLVDKTRAGMEDRAAQANLQPEPPATPGAPAPNKVGPSGPQSAPAEPTIRPIKANEERLPAGMSKSVRP